jgi:acetolactate synthase-1/2/3 large subunit
MVRQWQTLFYGERYSQTDLVRTSTASPTSSSSPTPTAASGCGETRSDVVGVIEKAMSIDDQPVVVDFIVGADAMVWPMVAAGTSNDDILAARGIRPVFDEEE